MATLSARETQEQAFHIGSDLAESGLPADEGNAELLELIEQSILPKEQVIKTFLEGYRLGVTELY